LTNFLLFSHTLFPDGQTLAEGAYRIVTHSCSTTPEVFAHVLLSLVAVMCSSAHVQSYFAVVEFVLSARLSGLSLVTYDPI
jgi:hypothetical protein